jgi:hypothetical protein
LETDLQASESPRKGGCDPGVLESYGAFERVMWSSDDDLRRWKFTASSFAVAAGLPTKS